MIWVEVLSRSHAVLARHRCDGAQVRIGRGYDNDIVLDDPWVDARHLRIVRSETGGLVAEDLGSVNGLHSDRSTDRVERLIVDGNGLIGVGRTWLRVREASHGVAPARVAQRPARSGPLLAVLAVATAGLASISHWLSEISELRPSGLVVLVLLLYGLVLVWAGVWAMLARIFTGHAAFERNLSIALGGALAFILGVEAFGMAPFALSWSDLAGYDYVGFWALLAVVGFLHVREMSSARLRLKGGVVAALAVVAIGTHTLFQLERSTDTLGLDRQGEGHRYLPPAFRLAPLRSEDDFLASAARLKNRIDGDRAE
jgi:hypothetical protein